MARARSIGNVYAELSVKDKMTVGMKKAGKSVDKLGSKLTDLGKKFAIGLPAAAFAGVTVAMKSAIDAGGDLQDMMNRTGADGEQLFIIGQAFKNAGLEASAVGDAVSRMQKTLVTGADKFEKIGLEADTLRKMDPAAAFRAVAESIAKIEDPAERTAAAMEVFGKSGSKMLAVINDPEAFAQAQEQVGGLGKALADNVGGLDSFGDKLGALRLKGLELGTGIAVGLLPELDKLVTKLGELDVSAAGSGIAEMFTEAGYFLSELAKVTGVSAVGKMIGEGLVSPELGETEKAKAAALANSWAQSDAAKASTAAAVDPFALPPGAEEARRAEYRMSAPFQSGEKDRALLDELRRQTKVLEAAQANGGLTW